MTGKKSLIAICTLLFTMLLPCWATGSSAEKILIQSPPSAGALPLIWIQETGVLGDGLELDIRISPDHQRGLALIAQDELDLLVTGVNVGAKAYNKGIDLRLMNTNIWGIDYLLTWGFQAESWSDLAGRSLSLPLQGGPLDFLARYFLGHYQVDLDTVDFVYLPSASGARTFQLGKVDAIILPEPQVTITLNSSPEAILSLDIQEEWGKLHGGEERIPFVGLFVRGSFAQEHPELVETLNEYYAQGAAWVNENPGEAAQLAQKYFQQPAPVVEQSLSRINLNIYPVEETKALIDLYFSEILEFYPEMIGGKLPDAHFYF